MKKLKHTETSREIQVPTKDLTKGFQELKKALETSIKKLKQAKLKTLEKAKRMFIG